MCVQSFHKVTGALTQSSVLHIGTGRVDKRRVERALKLVQSTSPSYLLMASLDAARYELAVRGEDMMERSLSLSDELRKGIRQIPGMSCMNSGLAGKYGVHGIDGTRVVIRCQNSSGYELKRRLMEEHRIELELADEKKCFGYSHPCKYGRRHSAFSGGTYGYCRKNAGMYLSGNSYAGFA